MFAVNPILTFLQQGLAQGQAPPTRRLTFKLERNWASVSDPRTYLEKYRDFQENKYEPSVFAREPPEDPRTQEFQRQRRLYFDSKGCPGRLQTLESVKKWPYMFGIPTRVSPQFINLVQCLF